MEFELGDKYKEGYYVISWEERYSGERPSDIIALKNVESLKEMGVDVSYELEEEFEDLVFVYYDMGSDDVDKFKNALKTLYTMRGDVIGEDIFLFVIDGKEVKDPTWEDVIEFAEGEIPQTEVATKEITKESMITPDDKFSQKQKEENDIKDVKSLISRLVREITLLWQRFPVEETLIEYDLLHPEVERQFNKAQDLLDKAVEEFDRLRSLLIEW